MTANMPALIIFFENSITFLYNQPTRTGLIFDIEIAISEAENHLRAADFDTAPLL